MSLELDVESIPPTTEPSTSVFISSADLMLMKESKLRALILMRDAQLAEMQKQNLFLKIYLKYSLSEQAEINEETGEVFYRAK